MNSSTYYNNSAACAYALTWWACYFEFAPILLAMHVKEQPA
jgi:hypothetical protein